MRIPDANPFKHVGRHAAGVATTRNQCVLTSLARNLLLGN
jgi:hypothetical protein